MKFISLYRHRAQLISPMRIHNFRYALMSVTALLFSVLSFDSAYAERDLTNFRIGVGSMIAHISDAGDALKDLEKAGIVLAVEYPQSQYSGSRFMIYQGGGSDNDYWGFETQLMLGWGLDRTGFRIHTGPAWHRDLVTLNTANGILKQRMSGWGWQLGVGYQWPRATIEFASTLRESGDYFDLNKRISQSKRPTVVFSNLLINYRF